MRASLGWSRPPSSSIGAARLRSSTTRWKPRTRRSRRTAASPSMSYIQLPEFSIPELAAYKPVLLQRYHIEVFIEKSTMDDLLIPLLEQYHINYIRGIGEMTYTRCCELMQRVIERAEGRPIRISTSATSIPAVCRCRSPLRARSSSSSAPSTTISTFRSGQSYSHASRRKNMIACRAFRSRMATSARRGSKSVSVKITRPSWTLLRPSIPASS